MGAKIDALNEQRNEWQNKYEKEVKEREEELNTLREKRGYDFEELTRLQDRMAQEVGEQKQKEEEQRNAVMIAKQRKEQMKRMEEAVEFLQEQGRDYMERMKVRAAAKKGGKKGKKGKKK